MGQELQETDRPETTEVGDGRTAYAAYGEAVGGVTYDGRPIPGWEDLGDKIRGGWAAAGGAVRASVLAPLYSGDAHKITTEQLGAFVAALGIAWTPETLASISVTPGKVTVVRWRLNEDGQPYMLPVPGEGKHEPATETVMIAVVDPPE